MIGQDCKQFEANIEKFVCVFLKEGESVGDKSFEKMRQIITLHHMFRDLAKDIRATTVDEERIVDFEKRAEQFFQTFKRYSSGLSTGKKPYLHILREHVAEFMKFWSVSFGYGYFNCNAGAEMCNRGIRNDSKAFRNEL